MPVAMGGPPQLAQLGYLYPGPLVNWRNQVRPRRMRLRPAGHPVLRFP